MRKQRNFRKLSRDIIDIVSRKYCYLDKRKKSFLKFKNFLNNEIKDVKDYPDFVSKVKRALSFFDDSHIRVVDKEGKVHGTRNSHGLQKKKNFDAKITRKYLKSCINKGTITIGKINDILYLGLNSFIPSEKDNFSWLSNQIPFTENKFIIDLRANIGGNDEFIMPLVYYLMGANKPSISSYFCFRENEKNPSRLSYFRPKYICSDSWKYPNKELDNKVIVLIGNYTCSAAELGALDILAVPYSVSIGDDTSGSTGRPRGYLVDGKNKGREIKTHEKPLIYGAVMAIHIPTRLAYDSNKKLIEDNGIVPKIKIDSEKSILNGRDFVLEKAIKLLS